jgi:PAS domain S-box-containing protein
MTSQKPSPTNKTDPAPHAETWHLLFENHPIPMWVYDLKTLAFLKINDAAVEKYGYSRAEFLRMTLKNIRPEEDVTRLLADVKKKRPALQHSGDWQHKLKDGRIIDVEITSHTLEIEGRKAALVMAQDVTERKREALLQEVLYQVLRAMSAQLDSDFVVRSAVETIVRLTGYPHVCIALPDENGTHWVVRGAAGSLATELGTTHPIHQGVIGRAFKTGQTQMVRDVLDDSNYVNDVRVANASALRSEFVTPIRRGDRLLGALNIESDRVDAFNDADAKMMQSVADAISLALENARLYGEAQQEITERKRAEVDLRRSTNELTALQATVLDISSPHSLPKLLNLIVERAASLLDASSGGLYLVEPEQRKVRCVVSYKTKSDFTGTLLDFGVGAAGHVAETGQPLIIDDYSKWAGRALLYEEKQPFQAMMSAPMLWQGKVSGVIHLLRDGVSKKFTQEELNLLLLFANHAAVAVENARLFSLLDQELTERVQAEEALQASEKQLRRITDNMFDVISEIDAQGNILYASPSHKWILGCDPEEILGQPIYERLHPDDAAEAIVALTEAINSSSMSVFVTFRYRHAAGHYLWMECNATLLHNGAGELTGAILCSRDITERKQAEEELQKLANVVNYSSELVNLATLDGKMIFLNESGSKMLGISPAEVEQTNIMQIIPTHFKKMVENELLPALLNTGNWIGDLQYMNLKTGQLTDVHATTFVIKDQITGAPLYLANVSLNITERKQAEEKLITITKAVESASDAVGISDAHGRHFYQNRALTELFGYATAAELQAAGGGSAVVKDPQVAKEMFEKIMSGKSWAGELEMVTKSGRVFPAYERADAIKDNDGNMIGLIGVITDITERKQAEKLQDAIYKIAQAADQTGSLDALYPTIHAIIQEVMVANNFYIALYDEKNDLLSFPFSVDKVDPLSVSQKPGKGLTEYVLRTAKSLLCDQALFNDLKQRGEVELVGVTSPIWLGVPLLIAGKAIGVMVVQDYEDAGAYGKREQRILEFVSSQVAIVIHRKRAEEEIRQLNANLERRVEERTRELHDTQEKLVRHEKLALLGQLAGGVGHELRNPLAVISNAVYFLKLVQPDASGKIKEYFGLIERETHNAEMIITDLLDFARLQSADREAVSVSELVQRVLARFPAPDSVTVSLDFPADLPQVFADPRQMMQVLGNLTVNACQAMTDGGKLVISAKPSTVNGQPSVAIAVQDTGVGITPENMKKLFEPLFTTKTKGIGLGLAVSRKLAEANGGRIEVQSEAGMGSTFTLWLPVQGGEP